ncbi:MAG: chlorite dismutase family protein [Micrococcaceae bacterium]
MDSKGHLFALWTIFKRVENGEATGKQSLKEIIQNFGKDVSCRGIYDVSMMRSDSDIMVWLTGNTAEALQEAMREIRRSTDMKGASISWSAMGVHREAEFNKSHVPGFTRGVEAEKWLCVYPFVRSYDWYILDPKERAEMLREHGIKGAAHKSVIANTVSAFGLNDYEWILPLEAPNVEDLVDVMRDLRNTKARLHVREEIPFYTGRMIDIEDIEEILS